MPKDIVPLSQARSELTRICEEVREKSSEKIIVKNGMRCAALISLERLNHYRGLEREHIHLALLRETVRGLDDLKKRKTLSLAELKSRHRTGNR